MTLTIYHNPRCTKSRETLALLQKRRLSPKIVEYLKTPPTAKELRDILGKLRLSAAQVVRKKEAAEAGIDPGAMKESELITAMVSNPVLIERPIVVNGPKAAIGRPPESVLKIL